MERIRWNELKSIRLKRVRGVSFEEVIQGEFLGIEQHPSRANQRILVVGCKGRIWAVPFVVDDEGIFLKTLYPSRKYQKLYRRRWFL